MEKYNGFVLFWKQGGKWGRIKSDCGQEIYVSWRGLKSPSEHSSLKSGQRVDFEIEKITVNDGEEDRAVNVTPEGGELSSKEGSYSSYEQNKGKRGGVYYKPPTYYDKSCGGYRGEYGTYGALMRNDIKKKDK